MKKKEIILHTDLKGRDWMYHSILYHVLDVKDNGTHIVTDKRTWKFASQEERDYFLAELLPTEDLSNLPAKNVIEFKGEKGSENLFLAMLGELKDDFDKMKTDEKYAKQASQRCRIVTTMTNLVKTRITLDKFNKNEGI